jgi:hypothetical protein
MDCLLNSRSLDRTAFSHYVYHRAMGRSLVRLFSRHVHMLRRDTALDLSAFDEAELEAERRAAAAADADAVVDAAEAAAAAGAEMQDDSDRDGDSKALAEGQPSDRRPPAGSRGGCADCAPVRCVLRVWSALCFAVWLGRLTVLLAIGLLMAVLRLIAYALRSAAPAVGLPLPIGSSDGAPARPPMTVRQFDDALTRRAFRYRSVDEYYVCAAPHPLPRAPPLSPFLGSCG